MRCFELLLTATLQANRNARLLTNAVLEVLVDVEGVGADEERMLGLFGLVRPLEALFVGLLIILLMALFLITLLELILELVGFLEVQFVGPLQVLFVGLFVLVKLVLDFDLMPLGNLMEMDSV